MQSTVMVKAGRREVMGIFVDPFKLTGIINHINILQVYDENNNKYVTLDKVEKFPKKFRVLYIFGTPDTKLITFPGYMEGPQIIPSGVKYTGNSDDETFYWTLEIFVKERQEGSEIFFNMNSIYKPSFTQKILGKEVKMLKDFSFVEHVLSAHILPYFKFYGYISDEGISEQ